MLSKVSNGEYIVLETGHKNPKKYSKQKTDEYIETLLRHFTELQDVFDDMAERDADIHQFVGESVRSKYQVEIGRLEELRRTLLTHNDDIEGV